VLPNDADARKKLAEVEKIVNKINFEKAIDSDQDYVPASKQINLDDMVVDESYDGPRYDDDAITVEFVEGALARMKDQKTLHSKYMFKLLLKAKDILGALPSLVDIPVAAGDQVTVCGDTHGQFYDVLNIFALNGKPSPSNPYVCCSSLFVSCDFIDFAAV